jgi:hypothetical protein
MTAIFDTLQFAKKAKEVGFTEAQAEFQAEEIARIIDETLATKTDLKELKKDIIIAVGGMLVAVVFVLPVIFKLINLI